MGVFRLNVNFDNIDNVDNSCEEHGLDVTSSFERIHLAAGATPQHLPLALALPFDLMASPICDFSSFRCSSLASLSQA